MDRYSHYYSQVEGIHCNDDGPVDAALTPIQSSAIPHFSPYNGNVGALPYGGFCKKDMRVTQSQRMPKHIHRAPAT